MGWVRAKTQNKKWDPHPQSLEWSLLLPRICVSRELGQELEPESSLVLCVRGGPLKPSFTYTVNDLEAHSISEPQSSLSLAVIL